MAFLDINPRAKGHTLIIPKKHYGSLLDMPEDEVYGLFNMAKITAKKVCSRLGASGFNLFMNNGPSAGQVIPHVHVHIMPRFDYDSGAAIEAGFPAIESLKPKLGETASLLRG